MDSIIDTITLAGTLVLAIPAALAGLEFLFVQGETTTGALLLFLAVALVFVQHRLTTPADIPGMVVKRVVGTVTTDPDADADEDRDVVDVPSEDDRS